MYSYIMSFMSELTPAQHQNLVFGVVGLVIFIILIVLVLVMELSGKKKDTPSKASSSKATPSKKSKEKFSLSYSPYSNLIF